MTWKCHAEDSIESRYGMILGSNILNILRLDNKFSEHIIIGGDGPYKRYSAPMSDASYYNFNYLTDTIIK